MEHQSDCRFDVLAAAMAAHAHVYHAESWVKPPLLMANLSSTLSQSCVQSAEWREKPWFCIVAVRLPMSLSGVFNNQLHLLR
jgi:hypothetical protein